MRIPYQKHSNPQKELQRRTGSLCVKHMGGCQNYDPFLGTLNIRYRSRIGIQRGTINLTTLLSFVFLNKF